MADYEGNVLHVPGMGPERWNPNVEELLASTVGYTQKGGTVKKGAGVLEVGTPLKFDKSSKTWSKADAATAEGFNRHAVDVTNEDMLVDIVLTGVINLDVRGLKDLDAETLATAVNGRLVNGFTCRALKF